jgi:hypothetical protein
VPKGLKTCCGFVSFYVLLSRGILAERSTLLSKSLVVVVLVKIFDLLSEMVERGLAHSASSIFLVLVGP